MTESDMRSTAWARKVPAILIVDDDQDTREALAELLVLTGYLVRTATNGKIALEQARENRPDLIVLDLAMPVMNGWQFLEVLRRDPGLAAIPVIIASASIDFRVDGAAVLMPKPFDLDALLAVVSRLCGDGRDHPDQLSA